MLSHMGTDCKVKILFYKCSRECWGNYNGNHWGDGASARFPHMSPAPGKSLTRKVLVFVLYQLGIVLATGLPGDPKRAKLGLQHMWSQRHSLVLSADKVKRPGLRLLESYDLCGNPGMAPLAQWPTKSPKFTRLHCPCLYRR